MMHVAIIGGTRHIGPFIVQLLLNAGHQVTVINRGRTRVALPAGVGNVVADASILARGLPPLTLSLPPLNFPQLYSPGHACPDFGPYVVRSCCLLYFCETA